MNFSKIIVAALIIAVIAVCAWQWWSFEQLPSVTFLQPHGGETWQPGETHELAWSTNAVPASYDISITIRRIPPPPLPEEGQEFDPIVFTGVPNTGTTSWTISPMYPDGTYVLGITAYESVPVMNPVTAESATFTITHPVLSPDLLRLYPGETWSATEAQDVTVGTTTYTGALVTAAAASDTMDPAATFTPFEQYYDKKLRGLGWSVANDLAAGGHTGGQTGYRKGTSVILVGFNIAYHSVPKNAPSECPCDVTLSLFSSN